ncbi:MAG: triacylglycerol lipase [Nocardioides sp.]|nr:triacylglycerol lipase [Nocardioides sp.]
MSVRSAMAALTAAVTTVVLLAVPAPAPATTAAVSQPAAAARAQTFHQYAGTRAQLARMERGTVIKTRTVRYSLQGLPVPIRVVQLLYRTTDQLGRPTTNVTSVLQPPVALRPDKVVAYGSFYDSLNPFDGPSYAVNGGRSPGTNIVHAELAFVAPLLLAGSPVVVADTQGRTADFAAGPEYGRTTLDSLRAALRSPEAGLAPRPDIALLGYSGGAIATGWAAALAPSYAPGIDRLLVGAAEGGVLVAPDNNLGYVSGSQVWAGVLAMALIGAARAFELDLDPYLNDYGRRLFARLDKASISEVLGAYPGLTWQQIARPRYRDPQSVRVYVQAVNKLNLGQRPSPTVPMYIGQGTGGDLEGTPGTKPGIGAGDGVMIAGDVRTLARTYCAAGTRVQYRQYPLSHFTSVPLFLPDAIAWVEARFAGLPAPSSCGSIPRGNSLAPVPVPR